MFYWVALALSTAQSAPTSLPASPYASLTVALKERCMSDAGVALVIQHVRDQESRDRTQTLALDRANVELSAAASKVPLDISLLRSAGEERDRLRYEMDRRQTSDTMDLLERLSADDRAIFALELDLNIPRPPRPPWVTGASCKR
jgi:hypothetical protein